MGVPAIHGWWHSNHGWRHPIEWQNLRMECNSSLYLLDDPAEWRKCADHWPAKSRSPAPGNGPLNHSMDALEVLAMELTPLTD